MRLLRFVQVETCRQLCLLKRYPLQAATSAASLILVSVVAWFGLHKAFFAHQDYQAVSSVLLWPMIMAALGFASTSLQEDIILGTIEQFYVVLPSMLFVVHCRALVYLTINVLMTFPLWFLGIHYLGGQQLISWFICNSVPLLLTVYGLGLALGGLTLLYRRTGNLLNLISLGVISLTLIQVPWSVCWGGVIFRNAFPIINAANVSNTHNKSEIFLRYLAGVIYLVAGQVVFRKAETRAKRLGLIGQY